MVENAADLDVRPELITVGGQSAGANLAAGLALKLRDEQGPRITLQLLEVPALDLTLSLPSHETYGTGYGLHVADVRRLGPLYLSSPDQATNPYASPLLAPDLSGLPPAYVMSAEYDMLRDDGERYVERLREAGVPATFSLQPGHVHFSGALTKVMASSEPGATSRRRPPRRPPGAAVEAVSSSRKAARTPVALDPDLARLLPVLETQEVVRYADSPIARRGPRTTTASPA